MHKVYRNVHMRKRWQIVNGIVECLSRFLSPSVSFRELIGCVLAIPDETYAWRFVHDLVPESLNIHTFRLKERLRAVLEKVGVEELQREMEMLRDESMKDPSKTDQFYRLQNIHQWLPYPNLTALMEETSKSTYVTKQ